MNVICSIMDSGSLFTNSQKKLTNKDETTNGNEEKLTEIISEYKELLDSQAVERKDLLTQVDNLAERTKHIDQIDSKIEHLVDLLTDIKGQISALSAIDDSGIQEDNSTKTDKKKISVPSVEPFLSPPEVATSKEEVEDFSKEIEEKTIDLDEDIKTLSELLDAKTLEIKQKDTFIAEINLRYENISDEKERLIVQLESLNSTIESWHGQLSLLQKLASSDPRYKVIGALKKHGSLSDIQLAFTMGTSIAQIRKYIDDLRDLELVRKDSSGRYTWSGQNIEDQLNT